MWDSLRQKDSVVYLTIPVQQGIVSHTVFVLPSRSGQRNSYLPLVTHWFFPFYKGFPSFQINLKTNASDIHTVAYMGYTH